MFLPTSILKTRNIAIFIFAMLSINANAESTKYNQVSFHTKAKKEVANDEIQANMYKEIQTKNVNTLATLLNTIMNSAIKTSKKYPSVSVTTGRQRTSPIYDKQEKIIGWTGRASVDIKSTDLESASQLIAELQNSMVLNNLNFGISEKKREQLKQELTVDVAGKFQQKAQVLSKAFGASGYNIVNVSLDAQSGYHPHNNLYMARSISAESAPPANQNFEAGNSTVTVTANGTIEIIR